MNSGEKSIPVPLSSGVALVIHSLEGGGAERVVSLLANHWAEHGVHVTLITLDRAETDVYSLNERVQRVGLGLMRESRSVGEALANNLVRLVRLRRAIRASRAKTVISFTDKINVTTLIACRGLRVAVVICERIDPRRHDVGRVWSWLRRRVYRWCRSLVVQTERVREWARPLVAGKPLYVIPNAAPAPTHEPSNQRPAESDRRRIVAMGRLVRQKGFDLLVEAFHRVAGRHPDWSLEILGEGEERGSLEGLRTKLGLAGRIALPGWTGRPEAAFRQAALFVLSSRYEGFPNVLLEAMAHGLPCISFDCESGPAEIIRHGVDGVLVAAGDVDALAQALDRLMSDEPFRASLGRRATEVAQRFSQELFFRRWDAVVQGVSEAEFAADYQSV